MCQRGSEPAGAADREADLVALHERIGSRFGRPEVRRRALTYLQGLLGSVERKNGWQLADHAGDARPDGLQRLLSTYRWDADGVRDDLREYVVEHLGDEQAVLVVVETGFLKQGRMSVGVERQYNRTAGKVENCQVGVFLAYVSRQGRTFLDRELYLPDDWSYDWERREKAGVPDEVPLPRTKSELAEDMIERALGAGVPFAWVAGDAVSCNDFSMRWWLEKQGVAHVLAVPCDQTLLTKRTDGAEWVTAQQLAQEIPDDDWQRTSAGEGSNEPPLYDWARVSLRTWEYLEEWNWLLVRRNIADPADLTYYACFSRADVPLAELARVAGHGWIIADALKEARQEVGLDQYEVRGWTGWYRHITLAMLAHAVLTIARHHAASGAEKGERQRPLIGPGASLP